MMALNSNSLSVDLSAQMNLTMKWVYKVYTGVPFRVSSSEKRVLVVTGDHASFSLVEFNTNRIRM